MLRPPQFRQISHLHSSQVVAPSSIIHLGAWKFIRHSLCWISGSNISEKARCKLVFWQLMPVVHPGNVQFFPKVRSQPWYEADQFECLGQTDALKYVEKIHAYWKFQC